MQLYNETSAILKFVYKKLPILGSFAIVLLIAAVGVYFRVHLSLHINGDYFRGNDSYRHVRHIRQIVSDGSLPSIDLMRNYPDGKKTTLNKIAFPWFIAQSYQLLHRCFSGLSLNKALALYPVVAIVVSSFIYFLLAIRFFDLLTAFLATLALLTAPAMIVRTSVGYVDTDSLLLLLFLLAVFFFKLSLDCSTCLKQITYKLISFSILALIGFFWEGIGLIAGIIYGCEFLIGIYRGFNKKQAVTSILGIFLYLGILLLPDNVYSRNLLEPSVLLAIAPAVLVSVLYGVTLISPNTPQYTILINKIINKRGLVSIFLIFLCLIYLLKEPLLSISEHLLFPFGGGAIMRNVAELQPIGFPKWWNHYGLLYPIGIIGFLLFAFQHCFEKKPFEGLRLHQTLFLGEMFTIILSRAFTPFLLQQSYWISFAVLILPLGWAVFHISYLVFRNGSERVLPFIIWFLVGFSSNSLAARFSLFFAPIFFLMGSFGVAITLKYVIPKLSGKIELSSLFALSMIAWLLFFCGSDILTLIGRVFGLIFDISTKNRLLLTLGFSLILFGRIIERLTSEMEMGKNIGKLCVFLIICTLCFFSYTGIYGLGIGQIGYVSAKRPIPRIEKFAHQIRENMLPNAVLAANWHYGSVINEIGRRTTIIDEEQNLARIQSYYKHVLFGKTWEESLSFLREYQTTHLMLTTDELGALNQHWKQAYPNQSENLPFVIPLESFQINHPTEIIIGLKPSQKFVRAFYQNSTLSDTLHISEITVGITNNKGRLTISRAPQAILESKDFTNLKSLREVVMGSKQWYFPEGELPVTIWLDVDLKEEPNPNLEFNLYNAFLLTPKAYELNSVKLFLNQPNQHFKEVITENNNHAKIWKIHY